SRVNFHKRIALMHHLAFGEIDLHDLAVNAAAYRNGVERSHRAEPVEINRQVALGRRCHHHWHNHGSAWPTPAAPSATLRTAGLRVLRFGVGSIAVEIPVAAARGQRQHQHPNPPSPTARSCPFAGTKIVMGDATVPQLRRFQMTHSISPVIRTAMPLTLANGATSVACACRGWSDDGTKPIEKSSL